MIHEAKSHNKEGSHQDTTQMLGNTIRFLEEAPRGWSLCYGDVKPLMTPSPPHQEMWPPGLWVPQGQQWPCCQLQRLDVRGHGTDCRLAVYFPTLPLLCQESTTRLQLHGGKARTQHLVSQPWQQEDTAPLGSASNLGRMLPHSFSVLTHV